MISDKFFNIQKENPISEILGICNTFLDWYKYIPIENEDDSYEEIIDAYAAFEAYLLSNSIQFERVVFNKDRRENINKCANFFDEIKIHYNEKMTLETLDFARNKYQQKYKIGFAYEFTEGDLKRIQTLINELRDIVAISEDFDSNHKERLLQRLEKLQSELHKRVSSLDKFWGLMGDAGVALGKFGEDAKPFVDRIKEISQIVWNTQTRAEELPSGTSFSLLDKNIKAGE